MKTFFKSLFIILCLLLISFWVYYSLEITTSNDYFLVVNSKIQGKRILSKGNYWIYPEKIIPGLVKTEIIEKESLMTGNVTVDLPYNKVLAMFDSYKITASYSFSYKWDKESLSSLYTQTPNDVLTKNKEIIEGIIQEATLENLTNFDSKKLEEIVNKKINDAHLLVKIHITFLPNLNQYNTLVDQIKKTATNTIFINNKIQDALKVAEEDQLLTLKKERLSKSIDFTLGIAKRIKNENVDSKTTLEILNYLINNNNTEKKN